MKLLRVPFLLSVLSFICIGIRAQGKIDRYAVVSRHDVIYSSPNLLAPLSIGNGKFAFNVDVTGLQTFPETYEAKVPLCTMGDFGWHKMPNLNNNTIEETYKEFDSHGRKVNYVYYRKGATGRQREAASYFLKNPSKMGLGQIGFELTKADGSKAVISDLKNIKQHLNLWKGTLESYFEFEGKPVIVETLVHPSSDMIAIHVESPLIKTGQLKIGVNFPYVNRRWSGGPEDWNSPEKHTTEVAAQKANRVDFNRTVDNVKYNCTVTFSKGGNMKGGIKHHYIFSGDSNSGKMDMTVSFGENKIPNQLPSFTQTLSATTNYWKNYWTEGGMIDLSESKDPRWKELERRIILSQYVMAVNNCTSVPPQETGLVMNSWYGKFHLEMHFWHAAHFSLWGRTPLMLKSLEYYKKILPAAKAIAERQGYKGARWPKQTDPSAVESPGVINPFLVWQQPHILYMLELAYRQNPNPMILQEWWEIIRETADFMTSFVAKDNSTGIYDIGPPLNDLHEGSSIETTKNSPFEVAYWRLGLKLAVQWSKRMGNEPNPSWNEVANNLAPLVVKNGCYDIPSTALALVPLTDDIDRTILEKTVKNETSTLKDKLCSWQYPSVAMEAARAGYPDLAIEALLFPSESNSVTDAGYVYWLPSVPVYLPGNGSLLAAVAMMAAGWDGAPAKNAPGFPENGSWKVRWEGLKVMP